MSLVPNGGYFLLIFAPEAGMSEVVWTKLSATLGRSDTKCSLKDNFLGVGRYKTISRQHGQIVWNKEKRCWDLKVLGKRGIHTNAQKVEKDEIVSLRMDRPTPIKMGESKFYFCPCIQPSPLLLSHQSK